MKHLMEANDDNSIVWTCDLFDIEQYNKEKKYMQLVKPSHIFVPVPNDDLDFKLHVFLFFLTVQLFEAVDRFVDIGGIVDHLCLYFFL